jgi:superoxide dismutase, Cu-Zn family
MTTRQTRRKSRNECVAVFSTADVLGEVVGHDTPKGLFLEATFTKLPPGPHGFHIHKAGDLRGKGCAGACAHFHKGASCSHGDQPGSKRERHTGDLGNIEMPPSGILKKIYVLRGVRVAELWGRSIIVHADEDDLGLGGHDDSKTTGHSGARIACAIIGRSKKC